MKSNIEQTENVSRKRLLQNPGICLFDLLLFAAAIFLDQYTKAAARDVLAGNPKELIPGILELYYLENNGAAFGMLQGKQVIFLLLTAIVFAGAVVLMVRMPNHAKYTKLNITLVFILAGAAGNAIDRIAKATVTDFIYVKAIHFPVFNVADIYITLGVLFFAFSLIFLYKEEDLEFLSFKKRKDEL